LYFSSFIGDFYGFLNDRSKNGIVYSYTFQSDKVVLRLHSTTNTFHFQGKEAISWFQEIFKTVAKQIHDECKLCVFSNQESSKTGNSVNTNISGGQNNSIFASVFN
jgi:hypothetical protein